MKCASCDGSLKVISRTHRYDESGLPNVSLSGVEVRQCGKCGHEEVAIPNIAGLHASLARAIVARGSAMTRQEFRFLREFLGHSSQDFAAMLGVTAETMSRWQSGKHEIPRSVDLLTRFLVARDVPRIDYTNELISHLKPQPARPPKIALQLKRNAWQAKTAA